MAKTEAQYQIEGDARTLVEAEVIKMDSKRFKAATAYQAKVNKAGQKAIKK